MSDARWTMKQVGGWPDALLALGGLLLACSVHGAIPGVMVPVHLQMLWSGGFAESLANQGWLAVTANDFGLPVPAPISFGLSGVLPMAAMIRVGLALPDAYALTVSLWLAVAFVGAVVLARRLGAHARTSIMLATCWLTLPVVWGHAGYSMLALGIALLPTYMWTAMSVLRAGEIGWKRCASIAPVAMAVALVAVFMDGYTFVMYGVASVLLILFSLQHRDASFRREAMWGATIQTVALGLAYAAYRRYVGGLPLERGAMDTFRAYGLDLHYLVVPTQGMHPVFDFLGWSAARSQLNQFGDFSVWTTTFALPLMILAGVSWWLDRGGNPRLSAALGAIALVSAYLALGPSLKVLSSAHFDPRYIASGIMPSSAGWFETGTAWISRTLPGFTSMRASYRWSALSLCCLWALIAFWMGRRWRGPQTVPVLFLAVAIALQLPDLQAQWKTKRELRAMFLSLDRSVSQDMASLDLKDTRAVFLPTGNDFLVNHVAARYRIRAFNIGGDKNLELARSHWPMSIRRAQGRSASDLMLDAHNILLRNDADAVVLPHVGMLEASLEWPCEAFSVMARLAPWSRRGELTGADSLRVSVPVGAQDAEHVNVLYLRMASVGRDGALPDLSIRAAPSGAVLQQFSAEGRWTTASRVRLTSSLWARLLLPPAPGCRSKSCERDVVLGWSDGVVTSEDLVFSNTGPECPGPRRDAIGPVLAAFRAEPAFEVHEARFFSVIRPSRSLLNMPLEERSGKLADFVSYPVSTNSAEPRHRLLLADGWYAPDPMHVWSKAEASLSLPAPAGCGNVPCDILLDFIAFGADAGHPVTVTATHVRTGAAVTWVVRSPERVVARVPLEVGTGLDDIHLSVAHAQSPLQRGVSLDDRVLGIGLQRIDIRPTARH